MMILQERPACKVFQDADAMHLIHIEKGVLGLRQGGNRWTVAEGNTIVIRNDKPCYWWNASRQQGSIVAFSVKPFGLSVNSQYNQFVFTNRQISKLQLVLNYISAVFFNNHLKKHSKILSMPMEKTGAFLTGKIIDHYCKTNCHRVCLNNSCKSN